MNCFFSSAEAVVTEETLLYAVSHADEKALYAANFFVQSATSTEYLAILDCVISEDDEEDDDAVFTPPEHPLTAIAVAFPLDDAPLDDDSLVDDSLVDAPLHFLYRESYSSDDDFCVESCFIVVTNELI